MFKAAAEGMGYIILYKTVICEYLRNIGQICRLAKIKSKTRQLIDEATKTRLNGIYEAIRAN